VSKIAKDTSPSQIFHLSFLPLNISARIILLHAHPQVVYGICVSSVTVKKELSFQGQRTDRWMDGSNNRQKDQKGDSYIYIYIFPQNCIISILVNKI